ncbi:MAG TPA: peptidoglycan DD-metalloendopeptidase family protein [Gaiellaceae bacterium]|nr:peptidoglycan DD-metalloendopeptidase family protein [Gaiellaceae bacterium]
MLLNLTTKALRLALPIVAFLVWAPVASAWSWPVQGPVLRTFAYDEAHPYAAGQHRGIDIGADARGDAVVAPTSGVVTFVGTVPANGESVTIETTDGYAVTLTHLGSIEVAKGAILGERDRVGTVGPSGTSEVSGPYVHLGIRVAADPNGYVDPLGLLPPPPPVGGGATDSGSASSQPTSSGAATVPSTAPASQPTPSSRDASPPQPTSSSQPVSPSAAGGASPTGESRSGHAAVRDRAHARTSRSGSRPARPQQRPSVAEAPAPHRSMPSDRRASSPASPAVGAGMERPAAETSAPLEPPALGSGHEPRSSEPAPQPAAIRPVSSEALLGLACNGAAALVALSAALATARGRRRRARRTPPTVAEVVQLPPRRVEHRRAA